MWTYIIFLRKSLYSADSNVKVRTGSPKTARNEQVCAHHKSYIQEVNFPMFGAVIHMRDYSCASILRFFSVVSDGATVDRQIPNRSFSSIL